MIMEMQAELERMRELRRASSQQELARNAIAARRGAGPTAEIVPLAERGSGSRGTDEDPRRLVSRSRRPASDAHERGTESRGHERTRWT